MIEDVFKNLRCVHQTSADVHIIIYQQLLAGPTLGMSGLLQACQLTLLITPHVLLHVLHLVVLL